MPTCTVCSQLKPTTDFFFKSKHLQKLHTQCKVCYAMKRKFYHRTHYQKYGDTYRLRAKIRRRRIQQALRMKMLDYLSDKQCSKCGIADPRVLDFDHIDRATKSFSIARGLTDGLHWDKILTEIQKCQILCANCHRIRTAAQFGWYRQ